MDDRCYVITRADLPVPQQAVQAAHAAQTFAGRHPGDYAQTTLVVLTVPDEPALRALRARFEATPARLTAFHEPDRGGELTAFCAAGASARRLCARLPMAFTP